MTQVIKQTDIPVVGQFTKYGLVTNVDNDFNIFVIITFNHTVCVTFLKEGWDETN